MIIQDINLFFLPIAILFLVIVDYESDKSAQVFQKRLFISMTVCTIVTMLLDVSHDLLEGQFFEGAFVILLMVNNLFFIFQQLSNSLIVLFLDYIINGARKRQGHLVILLSLVFIAYLILLSWNVSTGSIFYINEAHEYVRGTKIGIRLVMSYLPLGIALFNIIQGRKNLNKKQFILFVILVIPVLVGSALDLFFEGVRIMWSGVSLSLLFAYLFIVRSSYRRDALTGVMDRRSCDEQINIVYRSRRAGFYVVFLVDVDDFKQINDSYGHLKGDEALCDVANILTRSVRRKDFVGRYGGDEFLIIAGDGVPPEVIIDRINHHVAEFNRLDSKHYKLSLSVKGAMFMPGEWESEQEFFDHVDALMYQEKLERRAKVLE